LDIPEKLLDIEFQRPINVNLRDEKHLVCGSCSEVVKKECMKIFTDGVSDKFEECFNQYFERQEIQLFLFLIPDSSPVDTTYRKALRLSVIAETIADLSGYSMAYKAVKYAYYSHELVNLLIKGGLSVLLLPLMESLKEYGITGPTAILRVYYLGCKHSLTHKINSSIPKSLGFTTGQRHFLTCHLCSPLIACHFM
jgi:hypothetical protein